MTSPGTVRTTSCTWRGLLPAGRPFIALPSRAHPVLVAERDGAVLRYVRENMLAPAPRSRVPGWAYEAARLMLRVPGAWTAAPRLRSLVDAPGDAVETRVAAWLARTGYRTVVLDHSRDVDGSFILLLFPPGSGEPRIAVKVPTSEAALVRVNREREQLQRLQKAPLHVVRATMPQLIEMGEELPVLVATAQVGVPMLVSYYRNGHSGRPRAVRTDFAAAGAWLTALQSAPSGAPIQLDVAQSTVEAATRQLAEAPDELHVVLSLLAELRSRLGRHHVTPTVTHGDFWAGNIVMRGGVVSGVVDWERAATVGSPVRDLARFAVTYSQYLDRRTRSGRQVAGHPGLLGGAPGGGVGYVLNGAGWYPRLVRAFLEAGLQRLGLPSSLAAPAMLAELAAIAAEATDPGYCRDQWRVLRQLSECLR